jgi:hypothetical protein
MATKVDAARKSDVKDSLAFAAHERGQHTDSPPFPGAVHSGLTFCNGSKVVSTRLLSEHR